jgi:diguanylate cyclase (GGDEF)-like protein/PAS domain S-box-containing protein
MREEEIPMDTDSSLNSVQQQYNQETLLDAVEMFQALADKAPVLIWMTGTDKLITFFNKRWLEFTGRTLEQERGNGWLESIHPEDRDECLKLFYDLFDQRQEYASKFRLLTAEGVYNWVSLKASPFYLPTGEFTGYIGTGFDLSESTPVITELENQNYLIKTITDNATVGLFLTDIDFNITFMNAAAENIIGYTNQEVLGKNLHNLIHHTRPDGSPYPLEECPKEHALKEARIIRDFEDWFIRKNGEFFPVLCSSSPIITGGEHIGAVLEIRDITKEHKSDLALKKSEERFRALIEKSSDVISLIDEEGRNLYTSPSVKRVLGYEPNEFDDKSGFEFVHPADLNYVLEEFRKLLQHPGDTTLAEMRVRHKDSTWRWIETVSTNLINDSNINAIVVNFRDVTERKLAEEKAKYQFYHDSLTDLPNRNYFTEKLSELVENQEESLFGVLIMDLDRFKMINESLGHAIGDRMIQEVSLRLANCLEERDVLARLGGDEYGIILPNLTREEEIGQTCYRILEALKPAFRFEKHELYITPSIGIAVFPYDGQDVSSLLKNTDSALYRAKELGRNNFQYYSPSMNATTFQQLAMENTLRKALENNEFIVYYQPQIDVQSGKIIQVEALIRWMHPELGLTFPDEFITIAETTGLIQPIGEWVLKQACEDVKKWQDLGHDLNLAVNISVRQLRQKHLIRTIRKIVSDANFNPEKLELELTESVLVDNSHSVYNTLVQLKKDGVKFAIDDFNTGYSSLNYIKRFPIDILKIDRSFVKGIPGKEKDTAIANSIINLSHSLGMIVVAEGVERPDQLKFLKERNCDKAQGYMFSPPVGAAEMLQILERPQVQHNWPLE